MPTLPPHCCTARRCQVEHTWRNLRHDVIHQLCGWRAELPRSGLERRCPAIAVNGAGWVPAKNLLSQSSR